MFYHAISLHDGTVIAAYPMRKPAPRIIKRDHILFDSDGALRGNSRAGHDLSDTRVENRFRFQDIVANNLNTRRAIRELVLASIAELSAEVSRLQLLVDQLIEQHEPSGKPMRKSRGRK